MKPGSLEGFRDLLAEGEREICDALRRVIDRQLPDAESKIWHGHPV